MPLPIGPFPYILTNGTLADANQVMADFNLLLNGINGLAPLAQVTAGGISNVSANLATAGTSLTVTADTVIVATALNGTAYTLTSYSQSFNGATTGPGGMDTGTLPTSSFVALYAIYNPTAPAISILGKSAAVSAPTIYNGANMPAGYTASALLGVWPTNATPALHAGYLRGKRFQYVGAISVLSASPTNQASPVALGISSAVPPNAISVSGVGTINSSGGFVGSVVGIFMSDPIAAVYNCPYAYLSVSGALVSGSFPDLNLVAPQTMYYYTAGVAATSTATIQISAYTIP